LEPLKCYKSIAELFVETNLFENIHEANK